MEKRPIGNSGLTVAPLAFGGNVFGWTIDPATSFTLLDAFTAAGFNLIDTADVYSNWVPGNQGGESETIIGNWLKQSGKRDQVIIATKVGGEMSPGKKGLSPKHIRQSVEDSLQRLQTDYIDLYQSHYDDPATPLEETLGTYGELIKEGKIRAIGASNYTAERLAEALQISKQNNLPRYDSLQPEYNLYERQGYEKELEPLCRENNIGVINYFALASGFLTGKYRSEADLAKSKRGQGNKKYLNERGFRILAALDEVAQRYQTNAASIAIAWLLARPGITAPIASATSPEQLQALTKAATLQLDKEAVEMLDKASAT
ncbi:aldo/keto reductase [Adhaeribacter pallidiroseus]|uniref:Aryl-alcohol dehydrogenase (NADP(+)) n=1 Tax=Adhaeribacter pallidiroseus TaxID=2072847 RepID=A0A369QF34_9BACT|nr:aldo/keto reductase [Adhaeribacter pallidiroseus]RDC61867.1 Aryl-alcohol dehydrogenase (NADP(+)) [Adhaeribacter pallidiroseus]